MTLNNAEFDDVRGDLDADEPLDGRDSQPAEGSSDDPGEMDSVDPIRSVDKVLDDNDRDPLDLDPDFSVSVQPGEEPLDDEQEHLANASDHRETPDQG